MKKIQGLFFTLILVSFALAPLACNKPYTLGPFTPPPTSTPTLTATPNLTPVCGFTLIGLGPKVIDYPGPMVIRNSSDWNTFCSYSTGIVYISGTPTPTPTPPVDFTKQMLILYMTVVCPTSTLQVTNVCEGPTQVTVSANNLLACVFCNSASSSGNMEALVVPQSSLPVVWNYTTVPCSWSYSTPTPSPTP